MARKRCSLPRSACSTAFVRVYRAERRNIFFPQRKFAYRDIEVNDFPILVENFDLTAHTDVMQALYFQR